MGNCLEQAQSRRLVRSALGLTIVQAVKAFASALQGVTNLCLDHHSPLHQPKCQIAGQRHRSWLIPLCSQCSSRVLSITSDRPIFGITPTRRGMSSTRSWKSCSSLFIPPTIAQNSTFGRVSYTKDEWKVTLTSKIPNKVGLFYLTARPRLTILK